MKTLLLIAFIAALVGLIISMVIFFKLVFTKKRLTILKYR